MPQPPQFRLSKLVSMQTPLQKVVPRGPQSGLHWPWLHIDPGGQVSPHFPQFTGLVPRSTHEPLQLVPILHCIAHCPSTQGCPNRHADPHAPQFCGLDVKSTHTSEQSVPEGQVASTGVIRSVMLVSLGPVSSGPPPSIGGRTRYDSASSEERPQPLPVATMTAAAKTPHQRNRSKLAMEAPCANATRPARGRRRADASLLWHTSNPLAGFSSGPQATQAPVEAGFLPGRCAITPARAAARCFAVALSSACSYRLDASRAELLNAVSGR